MASTITTSIVTGGSNSHATSSSEANALASDFVTQGIIGSYTNTAGVAPNTGSFAVNAQGSPAMFVDVTAGTAYITATPTGQTSQALRAYMSANYTSYAISSNSSGSTKYDWIYLQVSATNANNPSAAADNVTSLFTSRSTSNTTDNGSPPTYGLLLAIVTVANGASSISNSQIQDKRTAATLNSPTTAGWTNLGVAPNTVAANGNRSYTCTFNSIDLTSTLSPGMRILTTRTVAAPTQCTSLNGTTQYYSKTSPAGMTFTDDFTVSAWVKVSSYAASAIVSRYNGTSGWDLTMQATGQIRLSGYNGGLVNNSYVQSYQSVPLNKWVHIAAQLDMSSFTATPTTSYVMFDGVDVPASVTRGGTNPTALVQAGNLEVGSENGGTVPFPGKIAQVAIYSAKVTEANILATISQGLAGTETSLISAYSFNNSINDLNANANNLTANGSAVATNADSPFGGQAGGSISSTLDYGIITAASFSTNTTLTVQVPEGCTIPTSGGVSAVAYSPHKVPYGFPAQRGKWWVETVQMAAQASAPTGGTIQNIANLQLSIPVGEWMASYYLSTYMKANGANLTGVITSALSTANNALPTDKRFANTVYMAATGATTAERIDTVRLHGLGVSLSSATPYYVVEYNQNTLTNFDIRATVSTEAATGISAELAYL